MERRKKEPAATDPVKDRTTIYLRKDLFKKIKFVAFQEDTNNTAVIEDALTDFFSRYEKKNGPIPVE